MDWSRIAKPCSDFRTPSDLMVRLSLNAVPFYASRGFASVEPLGIVLPSAGVLAAILMGRRP